MKFISGYLLVIIIIIAGLIGITMWQLNSFQQKLEHLSFSLPERSSLDSNIDVQKELNEMLSQITAQQNNNAAANDNATTTVDYFISPDRRLSFAYPLTWQKLTPENSSAQSTGTVIFSASQIDVNQSAFFYLVVREFPSGDADNVINTIKNEAGQQSKITIEESSQIGVDNGKIIILSTANNTTVSIPLVPTSLNGRIAVISLSDKSYTIEIYGPQTSGELLKKQADQIFSSIQIAVPVNLLNKPAE